MMNNENNKVNEETYSIYDPEIEQNWKKIERKSTKAGYRDGASDGREQHFQEFFDVGYKEGFRNAYLIGKCKGVLRSHKHLNEELLHNARRGWCVICGNDNLNNRAVSEVIDEQNKHTNSRIQALESKYAILNKNT